MSALEALEAGRRAAEALMLDECLITRPGTGSPVWHEATGDYTYPSAVVVTYSGPCKVQTSGLRTAEPEAGGQTYAVSTPTLHLPVGTSTSVEARQAVTITATIADPALVGHRFTITGPALGSLKTSRRLPISAVS